HTIQGSRRSPAQVAFQIVVALLCTGWRRSRMVTRRTSAGRHKSQGVDISRGDVVDKCAKVRSVPKFGKRWEDGVRILRRPNCIEAGFSERISIYPPLRIRIIKSVEIIVHPAVDVNLLAGEAVQVCARLRTAGGDCPSEGIVPI